MISGVDVVYFLFDVVLLLVVCCDLMLFVYYLLVMFGVMYLLFSFKFVRCYVFYVVWCYELFVLKLCFMFLCGLIIVGCYLGFYLVVVVFIFRLYKWI